jgi:hypothetical protein
MFGICKVHGTQGNNPMIFSRFEFKYVIKPSLESAIRRFIAPYVVPDDYAANQPGNAYMISSLYLDSSDYKLCAQTQKTIKNRFKLRMRYYAEDENEPVYIEIKRRVDRIIQKSRDQITRREAFEIVNCMQTGNMQLGFDLESRLNPYLSLIRDIQAKPAVLVKYRREAYEAMGGGAVRINFDHNLEYADFKGKFGFNGGDWKKVQPDGTIFEIKFTEHYPPWITELARLFNLQQTSVPKYVLSVEDLLKPSSPRLSGTFCN